MPGFRKKDFLRWRRESVGIISRNQSRTASRRCSIYDKWTPIKLLDSSRNNKHSNDDLWQYVPSFMLIFGIPFNVISTRLVRLTTGVSSAKQAFLFLAFSNKSRKQETYPRKSAQTAKNSTFFSVAFKINVQEILVKGSWNRLWYESNQCDWCARSVHVRTSYAYSYAFNLDIRF